MSASSSLHQTNIKAAYTVANAQMLAVEAECANSYKPGCSCPPELLAKRARAWANFVEAENAYNFSVVSRLTPDYVKKFGLDKI